MRTLLITDPHLDFGNLKEALFEAIQTEDYERILCTGDVHNKRKGVYQFLKQVNQQAHPDTDKIFLWGNHDLWGYHGQEHTLAEDAEKHDWITPDPGQPYTILDEWLLVNLRYTRQPTWQAWGGNSLNYTADGQFFNVHKFLAEEPYPAKCHSDMKISVSHLSPRADLPSQYQPNMMFINPKIDELIRCMGSQTHIYGHTHEPVDQEIQDIRYLNQPQRDLNYKPQTNFTPLNL